jgi:DUF4097 and DUF4098 domain-containing protein YvlB
VPAGGQLFGGMILPGVASVEGNPAPDPSVVAVYLEDTIMRALLRLLPLSIAAASLAAGPALGEEVTDRWERTFTIGSRPAVNILTDDGNVVMNTWNRRDVMVKITTVGWKIGTDGVRVNQEQTGDRVTVEALTPHWDFTWHHRSMRVEVWVPAESDLELKSGDGDIMVPAVRGRLSVSTGDGSIDVNGARGNLKLWTGDGRIRGTELEGTLDAHTGDGSVQVDGKFQGLTLRSGDGHITADVLPGSLMASGATAITGDGGLTLRLPRDFKAELEAYTGDGSIDVDLPLEVSGRLSHSSVHGTLNGGGPLVKLRSGDGRIKIEAR